MLSEDQYCNTRDHILIIIYLRRVSVVVCTKQHQNKHLEVAACLSLNTAVYFQSIICPPCPVKTKLQHKKKLHNISIRTTNFVRKTQHSSDTGDELNK